MGLHLQQRTGLDVDQRSATPQGKSLGEVPRRRLEIAELARPVPEGVGVSENAPDGGAMITISTSSLIVIVASTVRPRKSLTLTGQTTSPLITCVTRKPISL
jgi:hypothetical protein